MLNDAMLRPLQAVLNRRIDASEHARDLLRDLDDRVLAIDFAGTPIDIYIACDAELGVEVTGSYGRDPDAIISGTPIAIARLASEAGGSGVHIEGDADTARLFQALMAAAKPDWEEELSRLSGDVVAHQVGNALRGFGRWAMRAGSNLRADVGEYLQEESREVPAREEVEAFGENLQQLDAELAAAEARLAALESRGG